MTPDLHDVWHTFLKAADEAGVDQWHGYETITFCEQYADAHPEIRIVDCDDSRFASSILVMVPHRTPEQFMGVTVLVVPQFGAPGEILFFYPGHLEGLVDAATFYSEQARHVGRDQ